MLKRISAVYAVAVALFFISCAEDTLQDSFVPTPPEDPEPEDANLSPITAGTTLDYVFQQTFHLSSEPAAGGLTQGEKKTSGRLCVVVDDVQDTAKEAHEDAEQTLIAGRAKVTGLQAADIEYGDQSDGNATPEDVDEWHQGLWLEALLPQTRGHGLLEPTHVEFSTRQAPRPPAQSLSVLPFFEVRTDTNWGGWDNSSAARNFLTDITQGYFVDELDFQGFGSSATFLLRSTNNQSLCAAAKDQESCPAAPTCYWRNEHCVGRYELEVAWRKTASDAAPLLIGHDVVHWLKFVYTAEGILLRVEEYLMADPSPGTHLGNLEYTSNCAPCAYASIEWQENWNHTACAF